MTMGKDVKKETIGFIGLGLMGKPMALHLIDASFPVVVLTRSRVKADELVAKGGVWADTPRGVAAQSDIVIMMLPDSKTVEQVTLGTDGILQGSHPGMLVIDMGTSSPNVARQIAARGKAQGVTVLDAPVSGGEVGAINATLSIMVGGESSAFDRALPVFHVLGKTILHVGESGAGQITKACNQLIVGLTIDAVAEALALAEKAGVAPSKVRQALLGGFAASKVLELHGQRMIDGNFNPGGRARTQLKDLLIAIELAKQVGAQVPVTRQVSDLYRQLIDEGHGDEDHSALFKLISQGHGSQNPTATAPST